MSDSKKWQEDSKERWKDIKQESTKPKDSGVGYPTKKSYNKDNTAPALNKHDEEAYIEDKPDEAEATDNFSHLLICMSLQSNSNI